MKKVCIVMGSDSDLKVMGKCADKLAEFGVPFDVRVISAHRTPAAAEQLAKNAAADGFGVIIAAAGPEAMRLGARCLRSPMRGREWTGRPSTGSESPSSGPTVPAAGRRAAPGLGSRSALRLRQPTAHS